MWQLFLKNNVRVIFDTKILRFLFLGKLLRKCYQNLTIQLRHIANTNCRNSVEAELRNGEFPISGNYDFNM